MIPPRDRPSSPPDDAPGGEGWPEGTPWTPPGPPPAGPGGGAHARHTGGMSTFNQPPRWDQYANGSPVPQQHGPVATPDERLFATVAHLSAAIAWVVSVGWLNFVGPLVVWALFKDRSPFVRRASAGAFNFTLSMTIAGIVGWLLVFTIIGLPIGVLLIAGSGLATIVFGVLGALKTWRGESFTYPWQVRVLS